MLVAALAGMRTVAIDWLAASIAMRAQNKYYSDIKSNDRFGFSQPHMTPSDVLQEKGERK